MKKMILIGLFIINGIVFSKDLSTQNTAGIKENKETKVTYSNLMFKVGTTDKGATTRR